VKAALVLVSLCFVLALGALGLFYFGGREAPNEHRAATSSSMSNSTSQPATTDGRSDEVLARLDGFARELDELRAQIAVLKTGAAREPAVEIAAQKPLDEPASTFAALHRDAILKVIDDDRQEQKRKQDEEQRARDLQTAMARAERTAKQFGLVGDQAKSLADVYVLERQKIDDLRNQMRDAGGAVGDPAAMRQGFRDLRDWRLNELTNRLGADLAEKINEADAQRLGGGGEGGRRGNRGQGRSGGGQGGTDGGTDGGNRPGGGF
jgi:hypothetical protein